MEHAKEAAMRSARLRSGFLGLTVVMMWASAADAQPVAPSLAELNGLGQVKSNVTVTDTNGREFRGRIADASESLLSLRIGSEIRRFDKAEVRSVRVRTEDSLANGALIGAAVAGGLTSLQFLDNECRDDPACYEALTVYAGIGALAGLGIDALIHGNVVVYTAPAPGAHHMLTVAPMVARGRKGVRLTIAF
jgi:hypothetical protein